MDGCKQENKMTTGYEKEDVMKREGKRITAWIMAFIMVWSLVMVPGGQAQAAETITVTGDQVLTTSDNSVYLSYTSKLAFKKGVWGSTPEVDLYKYEFTLHNNTDQKISDWAITIKPNSSAYYNSGWSGISVDETTGKIVIGTYKGNGDDGEWSTAEVAAHDTVTGMGMQCRENIFENATIELTYHLGDSTQEPSVDDTKTDPAAIGQMNSKVTVNVKNSAQEGEYYQYTVAINNGLNESIGDWVVAVPVSGITSSPNWDGDWAKVKWSYTDSYMYITSKSGEVIPAGGSVSGESYKIQYNGSKALSTSEAKVYYVTGSTSTGAFDKVIANGTQPSGGSSSGGGGSTGGSTFDGSNIGTIDTSLDYNFAKLLQYSLYFYDANMCGDKVSETSLYSKDLYNGWRGNCHVNDKFTYNGKQYSAVGGYHDAGDHVKFGLPMAQAMTALGIGYHEFGEAFDELGQTQHLKKIVDYYCTYVKSCTVLNSSGTQAEAFCYQVGNGGADHANWTAPEVENESNTKRTTSEVATSSNPSTDIVSGTAAALALNYMNFKNPDDLAYAKALFKFAKNTSGKKVAECPGGFYTSSKWEDEYCLAAALLYDITKDETYATEYRNNNNNSGVYKRQVSKPYDWDNAYQVAAFYAPGGSSQLQEMQNWFNGIANANKTQYYCSSQWGSARYNCNVQLMMLLYDKIQNTDTYDAWCRYQMSIILGNNVKKRNLVCGYNTNSPKKPHHRAASGYSGWDEFNSDATEKYTLYGALCGGPSSNDFTTYNDSVRDSTTNEVTLDYNAGLVGAAAALYLKYRNSTDEGFTNQAISADFWGGSNFKPAGDTTTKATAITVTPTTLSLTEGETAPLSATVTPDEANQKVTWISSDKTVATVDTEGKVTAKAAGDAEITATTKDGTTLTATCAVTVTAAPKAELVAESTSISCDELEYGYTTGSSASVVITNKGNADANTTIAMEKGSASAFTLTGAVSAIAAGADATLTVQAKTGLAAGAYTDNIKVTYGKNELSIPVTVNVSKRAITITADNKEKTYGNANPQLTYQITSGNRIKGDSIDVTLSTSAKTDSDAGTYEIKVTTGTNDNYDITPVNGTLTVKPKEITDVVFPTAGDIEVGESLAKASLTGGSTEYGTFAWVDSSVTPERGTYSGDVKLTLSDTAKKNYTFSNVTGYEETTGTITRKVSVNVKRAGLPAITFPTASGLVYGQKLSDAVLTGGSTEYGTFAWEKPGRTVEEQDVTAGSLTATMKFAWSKKAMADYGISEQDEDAVLTKDITVIVAKADCTQTAENPVLVKRTSNSITVNTADGVEYSLNGKDWIQKKADESTVTFTGLSAFTKYSVVARYAETATHKAGAVSDKTDVYTLVEDPYVIDVSKATDANYMDTLRDEDGTTTATVADNVLTLDKKDKTYTICGNNEDITVKAENIAKIIFKDAKIKDLVIANTDDTVNTDIQIDKASDGTATDDVVIKGGIKADKGSVTITGDGKLSSGRIEATGSVTIKDANISVRGEKDVPAIKGDKVTIKDSTVKADVPKDSSKKAIESGNITLIGNNDISSTDGDKDIYSSEPKDENGQVLTQYEVKYLDSDGNEVKASEKVYKGTEVTLPKVPAKKGYAGKWKDASGKVYEVGTKQVVTDAVTYTVTYEKILVTKITLDSTSETLTVGDNTTLTATVTPDDAFDTSVQWSTNNAKVATVTDGTVTAVAAGTAEITATAKDGSGVKATCRITVLAKATQDSDQKGDKDPKQNDSDEDMDNDEPVDVAKITITGITRKVAPGKRIALKANIFPANADNQDVTWSIRSADKKYATVNSKGVVSVKKRAKGRKIVVMATSDEDDSIQAVYKITVMKQAVKKVKLIAKTKKIKVKKSTTIKAVLSPSKGISKEVSWTSSNPKIATVNAKGKVTGIKKGKVKITATAKDGSGRKAKITIQVK